MTADKAAEGVEGHTYRQETRAAARGGSVNAAAALDGDAAAVWTGVDTLPEPPTQQEGPVKAWRQDVVLPTYLPGEPDRNPMFLEKRVYQGSSGRVYPLPCIDRIATEAEPHRWIAYHIENEFLRLVILPEIGGRIHVGLDKRNGYDFFYRQHVIKPALVGLAGPWVSGGVEFNWPQHHRPATFLPTSVEIEREADGSVTVWCSDHDPLQHMKGMHGVRLSPGSALLEVRVRLYNRTQMTQSFLWWANAAMRVHEQYQSFFPPDVRFVADHAKRAITSFPFSDRPYYGVDYPARAAEGLPTEEQPRLFRPQGTYAANDLRWYANIPVPTSYMILGTQQDFLGGYDHAVDAGVVYVANHHIAPGKKQWTWGNQEFGYAWDRNLTDADGPYIELMGGVYTENQPDFSWLAPGETKTFSQFWYPLVGLGVAHAASVDAALHVERESREHARGALHLAIAVTRRVTGGTLTVMSGETVAALLEDLELTPAQIWRESFAVPHAGPLSVELRHARGTLLSYNEALAVDELEETDKLHEDAEDAEAAPEPATEPPSPEAVASVDELYLIGRHLEQYRHATRSPEPYWREALRPDPRDSRTNTALGQWHLHRGELQTAAELLRRAISRLTQRNPNPEEGAPFYLLGLTLRFLRQSDEAYRQFYKATWVAAWRAPAYHALAEMDCAQGHWAAALEHVQRALRADAENNRALALEIVVLRRLGRAAEADVLLRTSLQRDPLDVWLRFLTNGERPARAQAALDLALDLARCGLFGDAEVLLQALALEPHDGTAAMAGYLQAWLCAERGQTDRAAEFARRAAAAPPAYGFPNRIEEMLALRNACRLFPEDARAPYYLGNFYYDRQRHEEALQAWERSLALDPGFATAWRNLGIGRFNIRHDTPGARAAYEQAFQLDPSDTRVLYERDQLWKREGALPAERLAELDRYPAQVAQRDGLSLERAALLNLTGQPATALQLLQKRAFQPWEGGEGLVRAQYVRSVLLLGQEALRQNKAVEAEQFCRMAFHSPPNLSEARHLLANESEAWYWLGRAQAAQGKREEARKSFVAAASARGDFQQMRVESISEMTYWSALALRQMGDDAAADRLLRQICVYADALEAAPAMIDYFATSLPTLLLFEEDLTKTTRVRALFLRSQGLAGLGRREEALAVLNEVCALEPGHGETAALRRELEAAEGAC